MSIGGIGKHAHGERKVTVFDAEGDVAIKPGPTRIYHVNWYWPMSPISPNRCSIEFPSSCPPLRTPLQLSMNPSNQNTKPLFGKAMDSHPLLPGLPDDLALLCLARVPRIFHSDLTQVCESWKSLLQSPLFLSTRARLKLTQHFLYMLVRSPGSCSCWFVLNEHQSIRTVSALPPMPCSSLGSACVVLGTKLFVLGGSVNGKNPSPDVWVFDACYNKWESGPRMGVARNFPAAGVINGKIYVVGGFKIDNQAIPTSWIEVLDPSLGSWVFATGPNNGTERKMNANFVIEDKLFSVTDREGFVYDPEACSWSTVSPELGSCLTGIAAVVDGILYCYDSSSLRIMGYDIGENRWKELQGIENGLSKPLYNAKFCNVGEKLYIVWESVNWLKEIQLQCTMVEICKDSSGVLKGSFLWSDSIPCALPKEAKVIHLLSLEL